MVICIMATGYSNDYVSSVFRSASGWPIRAMLALFPVLELERRVERHLRGTRRPDRNEIPACGITESLERAAAHYHEHRWAFVEDVLDSAFHRYLESHWPRRCYFTAPFDKYKTYDKGFRWVDRNPGNDRWGSLLAPDALARGNPDLPPYVGHHPHIEMLFEYLRSEAFTERMVAFSGRSNRLRFNRFQLTTSYPGSFVAPHRDSAQDAESWISLIFHIAATGGANSGGLTLCRDNEFRDIIFESTPLTNTCLIFDPAAEFYHGVKPIDMGKYRWMVSAEYVSTD